MRRDIDITVDNTNNHDDWFLQQQISA